MAAGCDPKDIDWSMTMFRSKFTAVFLAGAVAFAVPAWAQTMVKDVEVSIDLPAISNPQAATYWARVAEDLENAIVARVIDRADPEKGAKISVDINELELASSFEAAMNLAESRLSGQVNVTSETDNSDYKSYDLAVSFEQAIAFLPAETDRTTLAWDSPIYYKAMIDAFADAVARNLD